METFDIRQSLLPFSLLQICNHFMRMKPGEVVEIICPERTIEQDIKRVLPKQSCEISLVASPAGDADGFRIRMCKTK